MKLMILGSERMLRTVAPLTGGCSFVHYSDISGAIDSLGRREVDAVLLDCQFPNLEDACCRIREITPAALFLFGLSGEENWKKAWGLDVDGFIPNKIGKPEFTARLKAGFRPCTYRGKVRV